ncbi:MAG: phosphomannomutase/phosphoglucomutase [Actinomycetota bacterium]
MDLNEIFKAYDVRGLYPDQLNEQIAARIGAAFANFCASKSILVAQDMRTSSGPLAQAFISGATSQGVNVVDIGLVSTDTLYFASGKYEMPGVIFTASHNPAQYNGIKMCREAAAPIGQDTGLADIRRLAEEGLPAVEPPGEVAGQDVVDEFVDHLLSFVDLSRLRPLKVVVDAANGMGGKMVPPLFERLPFELIPLYFELDGTFPNHPADPIQMENLAELRKTVLAQKADIGMAFDGDADRVFLVDEKADPVSGSLTAALVTARLLARHPGGVVVHNVVCSRVVPETILENGGKPVRTRVGHSFIKQIMAETGAVFGAEHSGHYFFRDNFRADSGLICALFVLEALSDEAQPLSQVLRKYRRYWNSGEINTVVHDQASKLKQVAEIYGDGEVDWTDGLTVDYPDWWFSLRGSNTEPLLRLNVEVSEPETGAEKTKKLLETIGG